MSPFDTRHRQHRVGARAAADSTTPACDWCAGESADTVLTIEQGGRTAVVAVGPSCARQLTALRLGIQAAAVALPARPPGTDGGGDDDASLMADVHRPDSIDWMRDGDERHFYDD